jgi:hypothetical protein
VTDVEMMRLCAAAVGITLGESNGQLYDKGTFAPWNPVTNDTQAMLLIRKFRLEVSGANTEWCVCKAIGDYESAHAATHNINLNRAICECVARMQRGQ